MIASGLMAGAAIIGTIGAILLLPQLGESMLLVDVLHHSQEGFGAFAHWYEGLGGQLVSVLGLAALVQVAALAGVPRSIIERARLRLRELEQSAQRHSDQQAPQLSLFELYGATAEETGDKAGSAIMEALESLDPDELTPRQALDQLFRLKAIAEAKS